ncbi:MAG: hypothetical protein OEW83_16125, partial [Acidimicrobiia bacterium]|nr:hypothetical protein [Acidimicrobiia bacterium]
MKLGRFGRNTVELPAQLEALDDAVDLATDRLPADHVDQARQVITKSGDRLRHGTNHTLVA